MKQSKTLRTELYHYTNIGSLLSILNEGEITTTDSDMNNLDEFKFKTINTQLPFISLTRDKNFHLIERTFFMEYNMCIKLCIDKDKLINYNRIRPFNYFCGTYGYVKTKAKLYEAEERVNRNIRVSSITRIEYSPNLLHKSNSLNDDVWVRNMYIFLGKDKNFSYKSNKMLLRYVMNKISKKYNIPIAIY